MPINKRKTYKLDMKSIIAKVAGGEALKMVEAERAFSIIMAGQASPVQIAGFLMALRARGETVEELTAAVSVMRAIMQPVQAPPEAVDLAGTGGDGAGTYNISTCASFVVAGAGIPVAKHGNRALSSKSGSADVLTELGVKLDLTPEQISHCIKQAGIGFMFAPAHHSAMKHVGPVRAELGARTIFNLVGPLCNPASVKRQMIGVFDGDWLEPVALALQHLGSEKAWVVHGNDGLDEITTTTVSRCIELDKGRLRHIVIDPGALGIKTVAPAALKGGDSATNARALHGVLAGIQDESLAPYRDAVLLNAAGAIVAAGRAYGLGEGLALARQSLKSGAAKTCLEQLIAASQEQDNKP